MGLHWRASDSERWQIGEREGKPLAWSKIARRFCDGWRAMAVHLRGQREGFGPGLTEIARLGETEDDAGIGLSVLKLAAGDRVETTLARETAFLLMSGELEVEAGKGESARWSRL